MATADYSQFGANTRSPSSMDDQAQNGYTGSNTGQYQRSQQFRPMAQQGMQPGTAGTTATAGGSSAAPTSPGGQAVNPTQGMTFSQMQQAGYARPPMPQQNPQMTNSGSLTNIEGSLGNSYANYQGSPSFNYSPYQPQSVQTQQTGQFTNPNQGSAINAATGQSVQNLLNNPDPYSTAAFQSQLQQTMGSIDDDYNQRDAALKGSIANRGLDAAGTIGATDQTYQNLQRRTAQGDAANSLLQTEAQTSAANRAQAINTAMGYGSNNYTQGLGTYQANANTNQQNFGQNVTAEQYGQQAQQQGYNQAQGAYTTNLGANAQNSAQQQQALNNYLGYGQQGFNNQLSTEQQNNTEQQQQQAFQLQLAQLGLA